MSGSSYQCQCFSNGSVTPILITKSPSYEVQNSQVTKFPVGIKFLGYKISIYRIPKLQNSEVTNFPLPNYEVTKFLKGTKFPKL
jgi:hypothetical protein